MNPHAGDPYVQHYAQSMERDRDIRNMRPDGNLSTRSGKWGNHQLIAMASSEAYEEITNYYREANLTPINPAYPKYSDSRNIVYRRTYLDFNGGNRWAQDPWNTPIAVQNGHDQEWIHRNCNTRFFTGPMVRTERMKTTSMLFATQSNFWNDRVSLLLGYRHDKLEQWGYTRDIDATTNETTKCDS